MKKLILITLSVLLFSCGQSSNNQENNDSNNNENQTIEEFKKIDTAGLSERLSHGNKRLTAEEVMRLYYPQESSGEGNEAITISERPIGNGFIEVTLIHANLPDDSTKDLKFVMKLKEEKQKWTVFSLRKNWKCRAGRGHTDWGIDLCK